MSDKQKEQQQMKDDPQWEFHPPQKLPLISRGADEVALYNLQNGIKTVLSLIQDTSSRSVTASNDIKKFTNELQLRSWNYDIVPEDIERLIREITPSDEDDEREIEKRKETIKTLRSLVALREICATFRIPSNYILGIPPIHNTEKADELLSVIEKMEGSL